MASTTPQAGQIDLVVIGDSFVAWSTWPEIYASMIETAAGVPVELHTDLAVAGSTPRLPVIKESDSAQELIRNAEAIVVQPEPSFAKPAWDLYFSGECGGEDGLQCFRDTAADYREFMDEYLDLVLELASDDAMIRVALTFTWAIDGLQPALREDDPAAFTALLDGLLSMLAEAQASAEERGLATIDVSVAFNSPDYRELAPVDYLKSDRLHLAEKGSRVVADLLDELGYEALVAS